MMARNTPVAQAASVAVQSRAGRSWRRPTARTIAVATARIARPAAGVKMANRVVVSATMASAMKAAVEPRKAAVSRLPAGGGAIGEDHDGEGVGEAEGDARRRRHGAAVGQRADQEGAGEGQDAPADLREDVEEERRSDGRNDPQRLARLLLVRERSRGGGGQRSGAEQRLLEAPDPGLERIQTRVRTFRIGGGHWG